MYTNAKVAKIHNAKIVQIILNIDIYEIFFYKVKHERLKIVFNDPVEEEKQKRIQLEQIKYLSRSMYNLQNQMSQFKFNTHKVESQSNVKTSITPVARLAHTMRQVNKLTGVFADFYPYRPDNNLISEKLCFHFYKQLHASIEKFSEQINFIPIDTAISVSDRLNSMMLSCDSYFSEFNQANHDIDSQHTVESKSNKQPSANKANILNVIRTARTGLTGSSKIGTSMQPKKNKSNSSTGVSIASASVIVSGKKVLPKSRMHIIDAKSDEESVVRLPMRLDISPPPPAIFKQPKVVRNVDKKKKPGQPVMRDFLKPKSQVQKQTKFAVEKSEQIPRRSPCRERSESKHEFEQLRPDDLNATVESNAFKHLSSPSIQINNFKNGRQSRSVERLKQREFAERMHRSNSIEKCKLLCKYNLFLLLVI